MWDVVLEMYLRLLFNDFFRFIRTGAGFEPLAFLVALIYRPPQLSVDCGRLICVLWQIGMCAVVDWCMLRQIGMCAVVDWYVCCGRLVFVLWQIGVCAVVDWYVCCGRLVFVLWQIGICAVVDWCVCCGRLVCVYWLLRGTINKIKLCIFRTISCGNNL